jgi:hypothetical protein
MLSKELSNLGMPGFLNAIFQDAIKGSSDHLRQVPYAPEEYMTAGYVSLSRHQMPDK